MQNEILSIEVPEARQFTIPKMLRMAMGNLRHHFASSVLQVVTIAATGAFLTYVLGELFAMRLAMSLQLEVDMPQGAMAQLIWMLVIALLVCTISNVVSMLLSVTKRFREIGTMKCLGAFDRSILVLFLMESMIQGGAGALVGAVVGGMFSLLLALMKYGLGIWSGAFLAGLLVAVGITFTTVVLLSFAGAAYPAWQASRMLPIEAMRSSI